MLKNIIFDFGGVICAFNQDALLQCFFTDPGDRALVKPILYREWDALDSGTADYAEYAAETCAMLPARLQDSARRFFSEWHLHMPPLPQT